MVIDCKFVKYKIRTSTIYIVPNIKKRCHIGTAICQLVVSCQQKTKRTKIIGPNVKNSNFI